MSEFTIAVITPEYAERECAHCQRKVLCFNAQCFREPFRPVITACKPCIEARAGGAGSVYVKQGSWQGLATVWQRGAKGSKPFPGRNAKFSQRDDPRTTSHADQGAIGRNRVEKGLVLDL